jgi:hypothetical protein
MTREEAETRLDCLCIAYTSQGLNKEYIRGRDELLAILTKPVDIEKALNDFEYHLRWSYEYHFKGQDDLSELETDRAREARAALLATVKGET